MNSCIQSDLSAIPKPMTKEIQTWMFPLLGRVWGCSHSSPESPSLKPWEICSSKSSTRLELEFSKYLVILVGNTHYIQGNLYHGMEGLGWPEPTDSMFFIFTFDSNGTTADIFFCRVNKFYQCCFKGHSLKIFCGTGNQSALLASVRLPPTEMLCCCTTGRGRINIRKLHSQAASARIKANHSL